MPAYADNIDIMGRTLRYATAAFADVEKKSAKIAAAVNEYKTKVMVSTRFDNL